MPDTKRRTTAKHLNAAFTMRGTSKEENKKFWNTFAHASKCGERKREEKKQHDKKHFYAIYNAEKEKK